ncbi:MAG: 50S ribosomal protein L21 [Bauldia sp.]|nr:50S ribosomal protein L21 [Bauldia sp.]
MFAVIKAGGRQYRVVGNDVIEIDRVADEIGSVIQFGDVLMVGGPDGTTVGAPIVAGVTVSGEVVEHHRGPKVIAFKKRRRKNSKRTRGHRQHHTLVRISAIGDTTFEKPVRAAKAAPAEANE